MMKYIKQNEFFVDADSSEDVEPSIERLEQQLYEAERQLESLPSNYPSADRAFLQLKIAGSLIELKRYEEAWKFAHELFEKFVDCEDWEQAILACELIFRADKTDALAALGQGIWLAITFPVDPEITINLLHYVVNETPADSDGAAVAAAAAHYIADLRGKEGKIKQELLLFTSNLLATVARRHSDINDQQDFSAWMTKLELDEPNKFLVRLRNIIDVMVQEEWWLDRDAIQTTLPS